MSILGDQLIRDETVAILELVKNSYDADAGNVWVTLTDVFRADRAGHISVRDDGTGMAPGVVTTRWLELATTSKTPVERMDETAQRLTAVPKVSTLGRIQLGEKGIGRLAAVKLGERIRMVTRSAEVNKETEVVFDIAKLDSAAYLDEFVFDMTVGVPQVFQGVEHGTSIEVERPRKQWTEEMVRRLETSLKRLASVESGSFVIHLECPEVGLRGALEPFDLGKAPYQIEGTVDANGTLNGRMMVTNSLGARPIELLSEVKVDLVQKINEGKPRRGERRHPMTKPPKCGPFRIEVKAFDLDSAGLRMAGLSISDRDYLKEISGASIIRDGFRVLPYGERGDDWLELNQRRVNDPTLRFSNNQILGAIRITRAENPDLRDKTNREGLIENQAYFDIRRLITAVLAILEEARFMVRPRRRMQAREDVVLRAIMKARELVTTDPRFLKAVDAVVKEYATWSQVVQERSELLMQVAGIGMAAETITHEIDRNIRLIDGNVKSLRALVTVRSSPEVMIPTLDALEEHVTGLREIVALLQPLQTAKRPRIQIQNVASVIHDVVRLFETDRATAGVKISVPVEKDFTVECTRSELLQVFMNLVDNAIYWLGTVQDRRLEIRVRGETKQVIFRDSGPGIKPEIANVVFEPFYTTKEDGRGLGLYIVEDIMTRRGWNVELASGDAEYRGANFVLTFAPKETELHAE